MKVSTFLPVVMLAVAALPVAPALAQSTSVRAQWIGHDDNWFDATNWSTGRVPDASTDVVIDGGVRVVIDPARGRTEIEIRDLTVSNGALLTTLPGTIMHTRDERVFGGGEVFYRSSGEEGGTLRVGLECTPQNILACAVEPLNGMRMNPTPKMKRDLVLKTGVVAQFGLGGPTASSITETRTGTVLHAGPGYYATLTADTVSLSGHLMLSLHYGFEPKAGDRFQIVTARQRLAGQFLGLPEGAPVACTDTNVALFISYRGGDGNDVVLTARDASPSTCLLVPAIQRVREST